MVFSTKRKKALGEGKNKIVYSTDPDFEERCPVCEVKLSACICKKETGKFRSPDTVEIRRETKGRRGKTVTVISKVGGDLKAPLKDLQKLCGVGGTVKQKNIELHGDQREKVKNYFSAHGRKIKFTGG